MVEDSGVGITKPGTKNFTEAVSASGDISMIALFVVSNVDEQYI